MECRALLLAPRPQAAARCRPGPTRRPPRVTPPLPPSAAGWSRTAPRICRNRPQHQIMAALARMQERISRTEEENLKRDAQTSRLEEEVARLKRRVLHLEAIAARVGPMYDEGLSAAPAQINPGHGPSDRTLEGWARPNLELVKGATALPAAHRSEGGGDGCSCRGVGNYCSVRGCSASIGGVVAWGGPVCCYNFGRENKLFSFTLNSSLVMWYMRVTVVYSVSCISR
ncbi:uncharacterized protein EV422DRAFT_395412 [Fimicolochytrium jonesii]|uniref:uncharacterized protein n=1 Tax=Fimicolochytrium jonesii TaxID=1396493 RepID=UPI0022FDCB0D|nr:uncharacterized protein EV422DRAFT_395412 [Fimicolochytrium jonesii]KAI8823188.1 hypothetical protein EV422DRAFT_395412 [Fimicolochytrium jonesii]